MRSRILTGLAAFFVLLLLLVPDDFAALSPWALVVIPLEALVGVAVVVLLPARARTVVGIVAGVVLSALTLLKLLDLGFGVTLSRQFDPLSDWSLFRAASEWVSESFGKTGAVVAVVVAILLALALPVLATLSILRLSKVVAVRRALALRVVAVLGVAWVALALLGVHVVPGVPIAGRSTTAAAYGHAAQLRADIADQAAYDREESTDAFRDVPGSQLLQGLKGKDVIFAFVESYGRDAVNYPQTAALLSARSASLTAAGFQTRSGWLTSSTIGGGSWLAHATFQSGLWIDSQRRYGKFVEGSRYTLTTAFSKAGWRTVAVMPANRRDWPEGRIYGFDHEYDDRTLGYKGQGYAFSSIPDQFTLHSFRRSELARPVSARQPVMAEIDLLSSHAPWDPVPPMMDWDTLGDGSTYPGNGGRGGNPNEVDGEDVSKVRDNYRRTVEYSVDSLVSYMEKYGDANTVLVMLGDHQPSPVITGPNPNRDVPITVVAKDPAVLPKIDSWGWSPGLAPAADGPVWRMDAFRDKFLSAFATP
ncbi:sulfatase [Asanoa sp. WMMD1127]|uniref:sulfatase n=1 Tax=Asanoa sp. WMMD1127 TaxID=3016107 RepID=UPI002417677F|nr:sulfatase [Asanoa sp. WMMD1127]MDG4823457.1 sulfatase [Asanoa sp. WMMD1127]